MITQEIKDFLNLHKLGYVATVSSDGKPNLSPKGTIIGWTSKILAFADIRSPDTVDYDDGLKQAIDIGGDVSGLA